MIDYCTEKSEIFIKSFQLIDFCAAFMTKKWESPTTLNQIWCWTVELRRLYFDIRILYKIIPNWQQLRTNYIVHNFILMFDVISFKLCVGAWKSLPNYVLTFSLTIFNVENYAMLTEFYFLILKILRLLSCGSSYVVMETFICLYIFLNSFLIMNNYF